MFLSPDDVTFMFNEMLQRSEQQFLRWVKYPLDFSLLLCSICRMLPKSDMEQNDDKLISLHSFLGALASIVEELDQVGWPFVIWFSWMVSPMLFSNADLGDIPVVLGTSGCTPDGGYATVTCEAPFHLLPLSHSPLFGAHPERQCLQRIPGESWLVSVSNLWPLIGDLLQWLVILWQFTRHLSGPAPTHWCLRPRSLQDLALG